MDLLYNGLYYYLYLWNSRKDHCEKGPKVTETCHLQSLICKSWMCKVFLCVSGFMNTITSVPLYSVHLLYMTNSDYAAYSTATWTLRSHTNVQLLLFRPVSRWCRSRCSATLPSRICQCGWDGELHWSLSLGCYSSVVSRCHPTCCLQTSPHTETERLSPIMLSVYIKIKHTSLQIQLCQTQQ